MVPPPPKIEKRIKIIKNNDGEVEVFENEDVMINSGSESIKEMDKEGKVIIIKKIKNKGDKEIEVEIQKKETEESHKND